MGTCWLASSLFWYVSLKIFLPNILFFCSISHKPWDFFPSLFLLAHISHVSPNPPCDLIVGHIQINAEGLGPFRFVISRIGAIENRGLSYSNGFNLIFLFKGVSYLNCLNQLALITFLVTINRCSLKRSQVTRRSPQRKCPFSSCPRSLPGEVTCSWSTWSLFMY